MLLPAPVIGLLTFLGMSAVLMLMFVLLLPGVLLKLVPLASTRRMATRYVLGVANLWVILNGLIYRLLQDVRWQVEIEGDIDPRSSYLIISNHQSWADILVLADAFHGRTWFPRFFLKRELLWVPVIGMGCWAMDMPFMRRHSREAVLRNPKLREDDLRTTRAFCAKYRDEPITVVNFLEGTRFDEHKRLLNQSPYRHLLRPKSAGLSFTLNAMGEQFAGIIDVSIAYKPVPAGRSIVWSWLCGRQQTLVLHAEVAHIPASTMVGDYETDDRFRAEFQSWVNDLWARKDARLGMLKVRARDGVPRPQTRPSSY
jgi:1-acyl-sn-glycerol-3-phosphate acyltransferase